MEDVETSIPARFEKIVRLHPDRLALKMGERGLTYAELNQYANRIARAIIEKRGTGSEPIALLFAPGSDAIAAILGVLKAGKFYVALDASFPEERNKYILQDSTAALILTNTESEGAVRELKANARALKIDDIDPAGAGDNPGLPLSPRDFASLIYTSGSAGAPKGVVGTHHIFLHSLVIFPKELRLSADDRSTLLHSVAFGSALTLLFHTLLNGGTLFPFDLKSEGIDRLARWLAQEQITVAHFPPAVFRQLAAIVAGREKDFSLRLIYLSGAPITRLDLELYKHAFSEPARLLIGMGSTEARWICYAILDRTFTFPHQGVPVGYPVPGATVLLLDHDGHEVPQGEIGEMAVKSRYLAAGYWRQPELTRAKFLPDPADRDQRIYLTGDLGRRLADGFLIHMGRKDFMVKIRGYRVEIGEIERALLSHPLIKDAGVVAWGPEPEENTLVAYVVAQPQSRLTVSELKANLRKQLPDYMIPQKFVFLDALPLTNGKLDRRALPEPDGQRPELSEPYVAPRTEIERELVRVWEEVLAVRSIGIHDNFFDLGGHSLAATRVLSRVLEKFPVKLGLINLFQTPTVAGLARHIAAHARTKRVQASIRLVAKSRNAQSYPLSLTQTRLWFLHRLEPESCAYNLLFVTRLSGRLDVTALKQSFDKVIERHEVLRTVFTEHHGEPRQVVLPSAVMDLAVVDLRQFAKDSPPEDRLPALALEFAQFPFDLRSGPLIRAKLLRLAEDRYVLLQAIHHIVYDAWSNGIFARDLSHFYNARVRGETPALEPLSIQYGDFAIWQQERFLAGEFQEDLEYWKKQLADITALQMPTDRAPYGMDTHRGGRETFILDKGLTAAIKKLGKEENATPFMTCLAAFQTLLHRYTGQDDIAVGTAVDDRSQPETEGVIGFFLNTLVIRSRFFGAPTFRKLLERVREVCLTAFHHRALPFESVVQALQPQRSLSYNPLFRVAFGFQNTPPFNLQLSGVTAQKWELNSGNSPFDLHCFLEEEGQTFKVSAVFNSALFDPETISRLLGHFQVLLEGVVANPDKPISDLPILTEPEKDRLFVQWNDTGREYPKNRCVHELFEAQVKRSPDATAVLFGDQQLSYRGLNGEANRMARHLRSLGVGPDVPVGICLKRSLDTIIALLATLKAGGAYLPLDPDYPKERLAYMLENTNAKVVVTEDRLIGRLPKSRARTLVLGSADSSGDSVGDENLPPLATPENLAYVMFTSGSSGEPKGVAVAHRGVLRLVCGVEYAQLDENRTLLHHSPASFDASTFEIWGALLHGGKCVVASGKLADPAAIAKILHRHKIDTLWLTSALFNLVVDELPEALSGVEQLLVGGEALSAAHVRRALAVLPRIRIINGYGPTEGTTFTCCYPLPAPPAQNEQAIPIGRPIANTEVYLLDQNGHPVPVGIPGELYIGGDGLARGYIANPQATAEKFVPHPFTTRAGARLYKSGDLARHRPGGSIEFLGRLDHQAKIRGFRIEPGEIESTLRRHPKIQDALTLAREEIPGDKRLVAYIIAGQGEPPRADELRDFLKQTLPDYMVPAAFVFLDALPLTANGKVDRKALPAPEVSGPEAPDSWLAPRNAVEEILAAIWAKLFNRNAIGVCDNFFDLGGHSLLATQLVSRVRKRLSLELPVRAVFENPTLAQLSAYIAALEAKNDGAAEALPDTAPGTEDVIL